MQPQDADESDDDEPHCRTRSGRISKPYDYSKHFPEIPHVQMTDEGSSAGLWLKPYYYDEDMVETLSTGIYYKESYFGGEVAEDNFNAVDTDHSIKRWDEKDKCQLYHEAMQ